LRRHCAGRPGAGAPPRRGGFLKLSITDAVPRPTLFRYPSRAEIAVAAYRVGGEGFDLCPELGVDFFEHGYFLTRQQLDKLAVRSGIRQTF
jgi:hypothetical protein